MRINEDAIASLLELHGAATPSPWYYSSGPNPDDGQTRAEYLLEMFRTNSDPVWTVFTPDEETDGSIVPAVTGDGPRSQANAALIANAVNFLPDLIAEIVTLRAERDQDVKDALRKAADALEAQPAKIQSNYVSTLRLYADEPWRLA